MKSKFLIEYWNEVTPDDEDVDDEPAYANVDDGGDDDDDDDGDDADNDGETSHISQQVNRTHPS